VGDTEVRVMELLTVNPLFTLTYSELSWFTTTTSQGPAVLPEREKLQVSEVLLMDETDPVIFVSPDFMSTTVPRLEVRLKFDPEIVTQEVPPL
jgi:hypothetical protein